MIGQEQLQRTMESMILSHTFPRFALIVGPAGSGKKTLLRELFQNLIYAEDNKVESVREIVKMVYSMHDSTFVFTDIDDMSLAAKNALLKVVEECPNNNSFIMTAEDENNVLDTIRSRAIIFHMDNYTADDLAEYINEHQPAESANTSLLLDICNYPGEVDLMCSFGVTEFYAYVQKVVDNIAVVSGANAFKIGEKLSFKENDGKYDLKLFLKTFLKCCVDKFSTASNFDILMYSIGCQITSKYIRDMRVKGINKQMLFDSWLLEIREAWR